MKERCGNPRHHAYARYGGRGITVAKAWLGLGGYERFLADVGRRPSPRHSLDRIDNAKGYEPGNVRWATDTQQARNKRNSRRFEAFGESLTAAEWSERTGVNPSIITARIRRLGWRPEDAVTIKPELGRNQGWNSARTSLRARNG